MLDILEYGIMELSRDVDYEQLHSAAVVTASLDKILFLTTAALCVKGGA